MRSFPCLNCCVRPSYTIVVATCLILVFIVLGVVTVAGSAVSLESKRLLALSIGVTDHLSFSCAAPRRMARLRSVLQDLREIRPRNCFAPDRVPRCLAPVRATLGVRGPWPATELTSKSKMLPCRRGSCARCRERLPGAMPWAAAEKLGLCCELFSLLLLKPLPSRSWRLRAVGPLERLWFPSAAAMVRVCRAYSGRTLLCERGYSVNDPASILSPRGIANRAYDFPLPLTCLSPKFDRSLRATRPPAVAPWRRSSCTVLPREKPPLAGTGSEYNDTVLLNRVTPNNLPINFAVFRAVEEKVLRSEHSCASSDKVRYLLPPAEPTKICRVPDYRRL